MHVSTKQTMKGVVSGTKRTKVLSEEGALALFNGLQTTASWAIQLSLPLSCPCQRLPLKVASNVNG